MNADKQRIAIAEACGWVRLGTNWYMPNGAGATADGGANEPPNYPADLNAMQQAEGLLFDSNEWSACKYEELLKRMTTSWAWHATAAQRAEAFLRTIGKWEDGE